MAGLGEGDGSELLDSLGVKALDASKVESSVLAKASEQFRLGDEVQDQEGTNDVSRARETLEGNLKAVTREIRAVRTALEGLEEASDAEDPDSEAQAQPQASTAQERHDALTQQSKGNSLQKAGLVQRLKDLKAKRSQWKEELDSLPETNDTEAQADNPADDGRGVQPATLQDIDPFESKAQGGMVETERDRLIRLGVLTPFDRLEGFERKQKSRDMDEEPEELSASARTARPASTSGRREPDPQFRRVVDQIREAEASRPRSKLVHHSELPKRERSTLRVEEKFWHQAASGHTNPIKKRRRQTLGRDPSKHTPLRKSRKRRRLVKARHSGSGTEHSDEDESSESLVSEYESLESESADESAEEGATDALGIYDDADPEVYTERLHTHFQSRQKELAKMAAAGESEPPHAEFDGGLKIPAEVFNKLFDYQKTGVKWLWELHTQRAGGIIGDEMGLGKTIQLAAFLAGLHFSKKFKASLIVCPATVLRQWLRELRLWYPEFRVAVLHDSQKSGMLSRPSKEKLIKEISKDPAGILVTSYEQMRIQKNLLTTVKWGYAILDEGHKIRNPDADVTLVAKQLQTVHRIIMTGSPIQNRLTELWSLFDFVFPGKLGTLPVFQTQFALPIQIGGYSNASAIQVSTAYKCAVVLRDLIAPYLLRRRKADVATQLPKKTEQVLFCSLTAMQRDLYRAFLGSKECADILQDRKNALAGIDILRKLCNHPDLLQRASWENVEDYGNTERSGKLVVALKVLEHWKKQGHKVLLFTQTQQMLDIVERSVQNQGWNYHRMDGSTNVSARARLVDDFNINKDVFVFLLTTKVGGVGINLTGANRVLVYDPDWNPSTDMQARERAWRIGQKKEVVVYRLITSGTIEEKVYHRQIYKQFLTNKVLSDPRQKRFFKAKDMSDLFQLGDQYAQAPETAQIFAGINSEIPLIEAGQATRLTTPSLSPAGAGPNSDAGPSPEMDGEQQGAEGAGDTNMLRTLLEGTGIMGALDHTKIERANDPESLSIDAQAAKVAKRAADALRRSRAEVQAAPVNVPTWTGRHGESGADTVVRRFGGPSRGGPSPSGLGNANKDHFGGATAGVTGSGAAPSSAALLAHLRSRQQQVNVAGLTAASNAAPAAQEDDTAMRLANKIVDFIAGKGNQVGSQVVIQHFQTEIGPSQAPLFRQLLQSVAKLQRGANGKEWKLRPEFMSAARVDQQ